MRSKDELFERVSQEAVEYKAAVERAKIIAKHEMSNRVRELTADARVEFSKFLHSAHAEGLAKDRIRAATGYHNNASSFNPVWDAFTPDAKTDLRSTSRSLSTTETPAKRFEWVADELRITLSTDEVVVIQDARMEKDEEADEEWVEFTPPEGYDEQYREINDLVTEALADQEFAGEDADADTDEEYPND